MSVTIGEMAIIWDPVTATRLFLNLEHRKGKIHVLWFKSGNLKIGIYVWILYRAKTTTIISFKPILCQKMFLLNFKPFLCYRLCKTTNIKMFFLDLRDFEQFGWLVWSRNGQHDTVVSHGDLSTESALMENVGVHLQARVDIFRDLGTDLSKKLHPSRWHEADFPLWKCFFFVYVLLARENLGK